MKTFEAVLLAIGLTACAGSGTEAPSHASSAEPTSGPTGSAVQTSPSASATTSAINDGSVTPARVPVNAAETLARLPQEAAVVGWMRPASADRLVDGATRGPAIRELFQKNLGHSSAATLLAALGVEPGAPIAFALVAPDRGEAEKLLDAAIKAKDDAALLAAKAKSPPNGTSLRFVARARPGADLVETLEKLAKPLRLTVTRCPDAKACKGLDGARAIITRAPWVGALFLEGDRLELEMAFTREPEERQLELLASRHNATRGAASGRCTALDPEADLSLCVDGDRAGQLGAAIGMQTTLDAVAGTGVDPKMRVEIVGQGKKESLRNVELANPKRRLLDDGTLVLTLSPNGFEARGSWAFTKETKPAQAKPEPELCVALDGVMNTLLPDLLQRFGDLGADFKQPKERVIHVREAGWGAWLVLAARTWPNFLGAMRDGAFVIGRVPVSKVCRAVASDRLTLRVEGAALPLLDGMTR